MKEGFWYAVSLRVVPTIFVWFVKVLFATCRITIHGQRYRDELRDRDIPVVGSIWHYAIIFILYYMRKESGVAMVSASKDGEYISRIAQKIGFATVRGSRNKGGVQAMKSLIRYMKQGRNGAIVADGSQGPARVAQAGPIVLASRAGAAVLPMLWSCSRYKRLGSWDGTSLPMPFSRIDLFFAEPFDVPPKIKSEEIEKYRVLLENRLNDLYREAWALQGKTEH